MPRIVVLLLAMLVLASPPSLSFAQVCTGDCSEDHQVTVNEVVQMVNIALGAAALGECLAADPSRDGAVTVDELQQAIRAALDGCPQVSTATPTPTETLTPTPTATATAEPTNTPSGLRIAILETSGRAGESVEIEAHLSGSDERIVAAASDILIDPQLVSVPLVMDRPDCTISARIGDGTSADKILTPSVIPQPSGKQLLRIGIFGFNLDPIGDGPIFRCRLILGQNVSGVITLDHTAGVADQLGRDLPASGGAGLIRVE